MDAGYDSDMSLEAYDLSEGPNTDGGSLYILHSTGDAIVCPWLSAGHHKCGRRLDRNPTCCNLLGDLSTVSAALGWCPANAAGHVPEQIQSFGLVVQTPIRASQPINSKAIVVRHS